MKKIGLLLVAIVLMLSGVLIAKSLQEDEVIEVSLYDNFEFSGKVGKLTTVEDIVSNLPSYVLEDRVVFIIDVWVNHIESNTEYVIEGRKGQTLSVITDQQPETKTKYNIYGSVSYYPGTTNRVVIYEKFRYPYYSDPSQKYKNQPHYVITKNLDKGN